MKPYPIQVFESDIQGVCKRIGALQTEIEQMAPGLEAVIHASATDYALARRFNEQVRLLRSAIGTLDFVCYRVTTPIVNWRERCGMDSVVQSAGRESVPDVLSTPYYPVKKGKK